VAADAYEEAADNFVNGRGSRAAFDAAKQRYTETLATIVAAGTVIKRNYAGTPLADAAALAVATATSTADVLGRLI
jgi:hypothetical protein